MGEVTIRLNRLGLEQGRMWQAVVAAIAIALPIMLWSGLEQIGGETTEKLDPSEAISVESYPVADATLQFLVPGEGWSTDLTLARQRRYLTRGRTTATVQVDTDVDSLRRLIERRADHLTSTQPGLAATNIREYHNTVNRLNGWRADLYGRDIAGSIVVVGNGKGAAATLIILAPYGQLDDSTADADDFVSSFILGGE